MLPKQNHLFYVCSGKPLYTNFSENECLPLEGQYLPASFYRAIIIIISHSPDLSFVSK